ncbi:MAG: cryptochrome/photolyase family protein, partial [Candidatus Atribacteria bacterium]|nr:cryptochrome/photolyase family protein [Candidatus Atribacteria bacterium]
MGRKTLWVIGNHLLFTSRIWENIERDTIILMVESEERARLFRYHKKKLVLVFSAMRHYAEELRKNGWAADYVWLAEGCDFYRALKRHVERYHPEKILVFRPADVSIAGNIEELFGRLGMPFCFVSNDLFLVDPAEFAFRVAGKKRLLMEQHYRFLRRRLQILLDYEGKPEGGRWNYDAQNRRPYSPEVRPGYIPMFTPDAVTQAVMEEVEKIFPDHPGSVRGFDYPVTRKETLGHLERFVEERLDLFGPYQDMMATAESHLYHSLLSPMLNIGLLHPREVVERVVEAYRQGRARLASVEAMVRQVIGWREFVYGISQSFLPRYLEGNYFDTHRSLPRFFWDGQTDLRCLR